MNNVCEDFLLYLIVNMYLVKRYDFLKLLKIKSKSSLQNEDIFLDNISSLHVSSNFLGNFFRLAVLYRLSFSWSHEQTISEEYFNGLVKRLNYAEEHYKKDANKWGLGLTYSLIARLYSLKETG